MEGRFKIEMKNLESDLEPVSVTKETFLQVILILYLFNFFVKKRRVVMIFSADSIFSLAVFLAKK